MTHVRNNCCYILHNLWETHLQKAIIIVMENSILHFIDLIAKIFTYTNK